VSPVKVVVSVAAQELVWVLLVPQMVALEVVVLAEFWNRNPIPFPAAQFACGD